MVKGRNALLVMVAVIAAAIVPMGPAVAGGGGGGCHTPGLSSARTTTIFMRDACFSPTLARVPVGATVTWINKDPMEHTVTSAGMVWGSLEDLATDASIKVRFSRAGVYPYYCMYHPGMAGAILVGDANGPGAAVSNAALVVPVKASSTDETSVKLGSTTKTRSGWPGFATGIAAGLALGLVGFGVGRRARFSR